MILTSEHQARAHRFPRNGVRTMPTYVVEATDDFVAAEDEEDGEGGEGEGEVVAWFGEAGCVGCEVPSLRFGVLVVAERGRLC